jgi:hypothetical protein
MTYTNCIKTLSGVLVISIILVSCSSKTNTEQSHPYSSETTIFTKYLKSQFNMELQDTLTYYFKVPSKGCFGCMQKMYTFFQSSTFRNHNCYAFIAATTPAEAMGLFSVERVLTDRDNHIDKLNIEPYSSALIITKNKEVINIVAIGPDDDMDNIVSKYF